jgi:hypothetical protein
MMHAKKIAAAGLIARGNSCAAAGRLVSAHERTVRRWRDEDVFQAEVERQRAELVPSPLGTLLLALTATRRDGSPDWPSRVRAAERLIAREAATATPDDDADLLEPWGP